jgi:hypothetical protein
LAQHYQENTDGFGGHGDAMRDWRQDWMGQAALAAALMPWLAVVAICPYRMTRGPLPIDRELVDDVLGVTLFLAAYLGSGAYHVRRSRFGMIALVLVVATFLCLPPLEMAVGNLIRDRIFRGGR